MANRQDLFEPLQDDGFVFLYQAWYIIFPKGLKIGRKKFTKDTGQNTFWITRNLSSIHVTFLSFPLFEFNRIVYD